MKSIVVSVAAALAMSASVAEATSYTFATLAVPFAGGATVANGINNSGQVVGLYFDAGGTGNHGFVYSGGTYTAINAPGSTATTYANGINDSGQIVGGFTDGAGKDHGFLDDSGTFTVLDGPNAGSTTNTGGINASGQVVGSSGSLFLHGFIETGGTFTTLDFPGAPSTQIADINDSGQIVGFYSQDYLGNPAHGFLYSAGIFTLIDVPGASSTHATGINNLGQIVGSFTAAGVDHGFLYDGTTFTTLDDIPGGSSTLAIGINDSGQISGRYLNAQGHFRGFIATPVPLPAAFLFPSALAALGRTRRPKSVSTGERSR